MIKGQSLLQNETNVISLEIKVSEIKERELTLEITFRALPDNCLFQLWLLNFFHPECLTTLPGEFLAPPS